MTKHTTYPNSILDNHSGYLSVFKESKCVEPLDHSESVCYSFKNKVQLEEITSWESVL